MAIAALRRAFPTKQPDLTPRDELERRLLAAATDYGVSLPHEALTAEALYV